MMVRLSKECRLGWKLTPLLALPLIVYNRDFFIVRAGKLTLLGLEGCGPSLKRIWTGRLGLSDVVPMGAVLDDDRG